MRKELNIKRLIVAVAISITAYSNVIADPSCPEGTHRITVWNKLPLNVMWSGIYPRDRDGVHTLSYQSASRCIKPNEAIHIVITGIGGDIDNYTSFAIVDACYNLNLSWGYVELEPC